MADYPGTTPGKTLEPRWGSLLGMMGYDVKTLPGLFGQYFEEPDPKWARYLEPSFRLAEEALGELPGQRRSMLGQLTAGLQERGVAAGRELQARRAGAGFAGAGALDRFGRTTRRGLEQEYGRGMWGIGQDIARREAGILGALTGKVGGFLEQLMAAGAGGASITPPDIPVTPVPGGEGGVEPGAGVNPLMSYDEWFSEMEESDPSSVEGSTLSELQELYGQYVTWWQGLGG